MPSIFFLSLDCFIYSTSFELTHKFLNLLSSFYKEGSWDFYTDYTESLDQCRKYYCYGLCLDDPSPSCSHRSSRIKCLWLVCCLARGLAVWVLQPSRVREAAYNVREGRRCALSLFCPFCSSCLGLPWMVKPQPCHPALESAEEGLKPPRKL